MAQMAGAMMRGKRQAVQYAQERKEVMDALAHTKISINQAYSSFNNVKDQDLIESYVFEINALQARYNYLVRRAKEMEQLT